LLTDWSCGDLRTLRTHSPGQIPDGWWSPMMGETAEYQRLQDTSEPEYQRLPSDDEEVYLYSSLDYTLVGILPHCFKKHG